MAIVLYLGFKYFCTFIDDHAHFSLVYHLKQKLDVLDVFKAFIVHVGLESGCRVETLQSDRGGEYFPNGLVIFVEKIVFCIDVLYLEHHNKMR